MSTVFRNTFAPNVFRAPRFRIGWILIAIAALNSLGWFVLRWAYENNLTMTQITVDYEDTKVMADAYQVPHPKFLKMLVNAGVTSLGLYQQSVGNLRDSGRIAITPREEAEHLFPAAKWNLLPAYRSIITTTRENQPLLQQVFDHLKTQAQPGLPPRMILLGNGGTTANALANGPAQFGIAIPASRELVSDVVVGFDPAQVKTAKDAGLVITARISNSLNLNLDRVRVMLDEAQQIGAHAIIFSEDEVVGYDSLIPEVAREMRNRQMVFGNIEFTKQRGWEDFSKQMEGLVVRVHSVGGDEAAKTKPELLVDRFVRAIRERDVRIAYIRLMRQVKGEYAIPPVPAPGEKFQPPAQLKSPLDQNLDFVRAVADGVREQPLPIPWLRPGLSLGAAGSFRDYPNEWLTAHTGSERGAKIVRYVGAFLTGLGAVGSVLLLLNLFFDLGRRAQTLWLLAGLLIIGVLAASSGVGTKLIALVAGCCMTPVGVLWGGLPQLWGSAEQEPNGTPVGGANGKASEANGNASTANGNAPAEPEVSFGQVFWRAFRILVQTSSLTFLGALMVVAAFSHWKYLSHSDEFFGEKATLLFPLIVVGVAFWGEVFPHRVAAEGALPSRRRALANVKRLLDQPFTLRIAAILFVLLIAGSLFIARTGNDSGIEISSFEWNFRALMEKLFLTRPRTKEMLVGNPAMIFAVYFALRRRSVWALGAVIVATIGQADILNTFCHFWTPLFYSLLRTVHGVWLGALFGGAALIVWMFIERRFLPRIGQSMPSDAGITMRKSEDGMVAETNGHAARPEPSGVVS